MSTAADPTLRAALARLTEFARKRYRLADLPPSAQQDVRTTLAAIADLMATDIHAGPLLEGAHVRVLARVDAGDLATISPADLRTLNRFVEARR